MQQNHFLLLEKLRNTESAQLCTKGSWKCHKRNAKVTHKEHKRITKGTPNDHKMITKGSQKEHQRITKVSQKDHSFVIPTLPSTPPAQICLSVRTPCLWRYVSAQDRPSVTLTSRYWRTLAGLRPAAGKKGRLALIVNFSTPAANWCNLIIAIIAIIGEKKVVLRCL